MADPLLDRSYPGHLARWLRTGVGVAALVRSVTLVPQLQLAADPATEMPLLWGGFVTGGTWPLITILWVGAGTALVVGVRTRIAAALLAILAFGVIGADAATYSNHLYLLSLAALGLAAAGGRLDGRADRPGPAWVTGWPIAVLRMQVSIVYLFAGLAKINEDFLSGLVLHEVLSASIFTAGAPEVLLRSPVLLMGAAFGVVAVELLIAAGLWVRRWSRFLVCAAVPLHAPMVLLAPSWTEALQLCVFALLMWTLLLAFHRPLERCPVHGASVATGPTPELARTG